MMKQALVVALSILAWCNLLNISTLLEVVTDTIPWGSTNITNTIDANSNDPPSLLEAATIDATDFVQDPRYRFRRENLVAGGHRCGSSKCLFPLKANPRYGYVAGVREGLLPRMQLAHDLQRQHNLNVGFGVRDEALIPPPSCHAVSRKTGRWLNGHKTGSDDKLRFHGTPDFEQHEGGGTVPVCVQLVAIMEEGALLLGGVPDKVMLGWERIDAWLGKVLEQGDPARVLSVFQEQLHEFRELLEVEPCLWRDVQFFVRTSGEIVHLDLDRCFDERHDNQKVRVVDKTIQDGRGRLRAFEGYIVHVLQTGSLPPRTLPASSASAAPPPPRPKTIVRQDLLTRTWEFAHQTIQKQYGMKHIYHHPDGTPTAPWPQVSPSSSALFVTTRSKDDAELKQHFAIHNKDARMRVLHNFEVQHARLEILLEEQPFLCYGFAILLERNGELVHTHLDRSFVYNSPALDFKPPPPSLVGHQKAISEIANTVEDILLSS